ncbi:MAG: VWA domain-containing protein [Planctomycetes bacterium]|nr:VWA domain-containing protein [Planctomycetota bacterium]
MRAKSLFLLILVALIAVPLTASEFGDLKKKIKDYMKSTKIKSAEKANVIRQLKDFQTEDSVKLCFDIVEAPDKISAKYEKEKDKYIKELDKLEKVIQELAARSTGSGRISVGEYNQLVDALNRRNEILNKKLPAIEDKLRESAVMKNAAIYVLQRLESPEARDAMLEGLECSSWKTVFAALEAFKYQKWKGAFKGLIKLYPVTKKPHKNAQVRALVLSTMLVIISDDGIDDKYIEKAKNTFIVALEDISWLVRSNAVKGLGYIADEDCIGPLIEALARETGRLKWEIVKILQNITGKKFADDTKAWRAWWKANKDDFEPVKKGKDAVAGREEGSHDTAEFYKIKLVSDAPIFIIDRSGSMKQPADTNYHKKMLEKWIREHKAEIEEAIRQGIPWYPLIEPKPPHKSRWGVLQMKLKKAIESLSEKNATFNIVWYSNDVDVFSTEMTKASKSNKKKATKQIDKMDADGMTNIHDALKRAFEIAVGAKPGQGGGVLTNDKGELFADTIFFLTDGHPTWGPVQNPDQIIRLVNEWNANLQIKIHTIGIGIEVDTEQHDFLKRLAEDNQGKCELVNREPKDEDDED